MAISAVDADEDEALDIEGEPSAEDLAALYAMVTPSAHDDMKPEAKKARPVATAAPAPAPVTGSAAPAAAPNVWKRLFLAGAGIVAVVAILVGANAVVNGTPAASPAASQAAVDPNQPPAVDEAKVAGLMERIAADPKDIEALLDLGNEYYNGMQFDTAATFFDRVLGVDPKHIQGLLARGAVYFNLNDLANAESTWKKVVAIDPENVEAHYDLGFLYLNQPTPDWDGVKAEWTRVVELDPESDLAKTVQAHLDSLVMAVHDAGRIARARGIPPRPPRRPPPRRHRRRRAPSRDRPRQHPRHRPRLRRRCRVVRVPVLPAAGPGLHELHGRRDR